LAADLAVTSSTKNSSNFNCTFLNNLQWLIFIWL